MLGLFLVELQAALLLRLVPDEAHRATGVSAKFLRTSWDISGDDVNRPLASFGLLNLLNSTLFLR